MNKKIDSAKVVIAGAGSAGYGIFKILEKAGCKDIVVNGSRGAIYEGRKDLKGYNNKKRDDKDNNENETSKQEISRKSNPRKLRGNLSDIIRGTDVFIGVSGKPRLLSTGMVKSMSQDAIIFALSNPDPEIIPPDALKAGARIVATGRSDYPNQVNNAVVFPSVLRALLDMRAKGLDEDMLVAASYAIAFLVERSHLN